MPENRKLSLIQCSKGTQEKVNITNQNFRDCFLCAVNSEFWRTGGAFCDYGIVLTRYNASPNPNIMAINNHYLDKELSKNVVVSDIFHEITETQYREKQKTEMNCGKQKKLKETDITYNYILRGFRDYSLLYNGCRSITSLKLKFFSFHSILDLSRLCYYCENLTELKVKIDIKRPTCELNLEEFVSNCKWLKSIKFVNNTDIKFINLSKMIQGCNSLKKIKIKGFRISALSDYIEEELNKKGLKNILLPLKENPTDSKIKISFKICRINSNWGRNLKVFIEKEKKTDFFWNRLSRGNKKLESLYRDMLKEIIFGNK